MEVVEAVAIKRRARLSMLGIKYGWEVSDDHYAACKQLGWVAVEINPPGDQHELSLHGTAHAACLELAESVRKDGLWWPVSIHDLDSYAWETPIEVKVSVTVEATSEDMHAIGSTTTPVVALKIASDDPRFPDDDHEEGPVVD